MYLSFRHLCGSGLVTFALALGSLSSAAAETAAGSIEQRNKEVVTRYINELWNDLRYDVIDEVLAPDLLAYAPDGTTERGNQRFRQLIPAVRKAFPDLHLRIDEMLAEGQRVAVRLRISATHEGDFAGIAPTHRHIDAAEWFFFRLSDGKILEYWYLRDQDGLLRQLRARE